MTVKDDQKVPGGRGMKHEFPARESEKEHLYYTQKVTETFPIFRVLTFRKLSGNFPRKLSEETFRYNARRKLTNHGG